MGKVSNYQKLSLLLWKNMKLKSGHKLALIIEMLLPVVFTLLIVYVRTIVTTEKMPVTSFDPVPIDSLKILQKRALLAYQMQTLMPIQQASSKKTNLQPRMLLKVLMTPPNPILEQIVGSAVRSLFIAASYDTAPDEETLEAECVSKNYFAGVVFDESLRNLKDIKDLNNFHYTLRFPSELRTATFKFRVTWETNRLFPYYRMPGPRNKNYSDGGVPPGYLVEGFLPLQNLLTRTFLEMRSGENNLPNVQMERYPYPPYIYDPLLTGLGNLLPLLLLLSFLYPCANITKDVATEKEKQLKEVMKIMGLNGWLHWIAWFLKSFAFLAVSCCFVVICLKVQIDGVSVLTFSSALVIYTFLLVWVATLICFCFLLSTFFNKANTAAAVCGLVMFLVFSPFSFIAQSSEQVDTGTRLLLCLLVNSAMGFGTNVIMAFEGTGEGMHWHNIFSPTSVDDSLSLGAVMGMMLLSCVIYMILCLYIEKIFPGDYGVPEKWYFPFTLEFWCGSKKIPSNDEVSRNISEQEKPETFESEPDGKHAGVQVLNLRKQFGKKVAVKGVSLNMYENEITVLLGHNGAGKTTTISMLTGMYPPTSGTAIINGSDIRSNIRGARMSLGLCPQHNVLFDGMTVRDHLIFFTRLKGVTGPAVDIEVEKYLKLIGLEDKAKKASKTLSGGMKRKLSLCCALCGGAKVVLCDEPSSGLDPAARRQLWNLLQSEKTGRTILLTTHFMDEADVLGDRIAIMCDGEIKCVGSSFFLKKKYGSGYRLICVKESECNEAEVTALLRSHIADIEPESNIGSELSYQLDDEHSKFEAMFRDLEKNARALHISGYGIAATSLEEVFMKVGSENAADGTRISHREILRGGNGFNEDIESISSADGLFSNRRQLKRGFKLTASQWHAMFLKKYLYTKRNWLRFLIQIIIPIFYISITILISRNTARFAPLRPMTFDLDQYPKAYVVLDTATSPEKDTLLDKSMQEYKALVKSHGSGYELETTGSKNFHDYILEKGKSMQVRIDSQYVAAATFENESITAWLNNQPLHTAPLTVNMVYNAIARALFENETVDIKVTNSPLPYSFETVTERLITGRNLGTQLAMNLCFAMCLVITCYIFFLIKERQSRAKLLQFVSGVRVWTFWLTQLIFDYMTFIIIAVVAVCTLACFHEDGFSTFEELGLILLVLLIFALSALPFTYVLSLFFKEPANGFVRVSYINLFTGLALFVVITVMSLPLYDTKATADVLKWIFMVFPHFALAFSLNDLYQNDQIKTTCQKYSDMGIDMCAFFEQCCDLKPFFAWETPGILKEVLYLVATGTILFLILIMYEFGYINELIYKCRAMSLKPPRESPNLMDDDVRKEYEVVSNLSEDQMESRNLVMSRVTKVYGNFVAVNQISLCVQGYECFGLLGVNGAGKTSTFKMLTGDERITFGEAYVRGLNLKMQINDVYKEIGYCPQFDAFLDDLTGKETLKIFCLLRGVSQRNIPSNIDELAKSFGFMKHLNKPSKTYSGGNKRKLSAAIACVGNPSIIYMDEPTSGIDPAARRQLWNMLCRIRDSGKSIVLTSHSMEECEAICTRLAIMVNGEFKCLGSTQHLKNKFSKGLVLKIKVRKEKKTMINNEKSINDVFQVDIENIKTFIEEQFPEAELKEQYEGILTFYIPLTDIKWSEIFGLMEKNREVLNIEDYSVSQTTLEEIFLEFAATQREEDQK